MLLHALLGSRCRLANRIAEPQHVHVALPHLARRYYVSLTAGGLVPTINHSAGAHPGSLTAASESSETAPVNVTSPLEPHHAINNASQPLRDIFDLALRSWYTAEDNT